MKSTTVAVTEWLDDILSKYNNECIEQFFIESTLLVQLFNFKRLNNRIEKKYVFIRRLKQIIKNNNKYKFIKLSELERVNSKRLTYFKIEGNVSDRITIRSDRKVTKNLDKIHSDSIANFTDSSPSVVTDMGDKRINFMVIQAPNIITKTRPIMSSTPTLNVTLLHSPLPTTEEVNTRVTPAKTVTKFPLLHALH